MKFSLSWVNALLKSELDLSKVVPQLINLGIEVESTESTADGDDIIEVAVYPNRGDILSIRGIARELAVANNLSLPGLNEYNVEKYSDKSVDLQVENEQDCPLYSCRVIENIDCNAKTPGWMQQRLRSAGLHVKSLIVDITNYVMLELGQPLHAFDAEKISGSLVVRNAQQDENITLLDNTKIKLDRNCLVIADQHGVQSLAGVMGGVNSAVSDATKTVILESAYFSPRAIRAANQKYKLNTDAAYRFSRGVDFKLILTALEYASELIVELATAKAASAVKHIANNYLPERKEITITQAEITKLLGITVPQNQVVSILKQLQCQIISKQNDSCTVAVPSHRHDLELPVDLIEEILRVIGYDKVPSSMPAIHTNFHANTKDILTNTAIRSELTARGYFEVINYSFINKEFLEQLFDSDCNSLLLSNPLSSDMNIMRPSLLPGLLRNLQQNLNRQQYSMKLFETGVRFIVEDSGAIKEVATLSGIAVGNVFQEQWGMKPQVIDFFDIKADLENLISLSNQTNKLNITTTSHKLLHPGKAAAIELAGNQVGFLGALAPEIIASLDLPTNVIVFELDLEPLSKVNLPIIKPLSRYPTVRRDLALIVSSEVAVSDINFAITEVVGDLLADLCVFDVFQGKNIAAGKKSIALGIVLRDLNKTLDESEVNSIVARVLDVLQQKFQVELRD